MLRSGLDRAFVRYARTGDPGALARVFDGSAAELYRLGFHLLGDRHAAQDLVQHTFVVAIEQAKSFDGSRRVLPWLCGILTNRALHQRRQVRQRAAASEGHDLAERAVDPAAEAGAREAEVVVAAAARSLAEPYRQVLLLHLVHELQPKDIAEALARPDATVRTQLARGLELLRKALPLGIAGFAAGQVPPPVRLGSVRAAVLARAADVAATAGAASASVVVFTGVVAMKKVLFVLAALLAVVFAWPWIVPGEPAPVAAVDAGARAPTPVVAGTPAAPQADTVVGSERVEAPAAVDASTASLEVRVSWSDGAPAADVPVRVRPRPLDVETWLRVVRTDDGGVARFERLPPGAANALTNRDADIDVELVQGATANATITLTRGIDVRGRVVDLAERPIAGATVWMSVIGASDDSEPLAVTGSDGAFHIRDAVVGFVVTATAPGLGCAKEAWVEQREIVLTLRPAAGVLAGTVVDPRGQPVAGARVLVGQTITTSGGRHTRFQVVGQDLWPSRFVRTDVDGRFRCDGLPVIPWPVWVGAPGFAPSWQEVPLRADVETTITVRLTQGATVRGRVTDSQGRPVTGELVSARQELPVPHVLIGAGLRIGSSPLWARMFAKTDANGRYDLARVMPGTVELATWHDGADARIQCELAEGQVFAWDPVVAPRPGQPLHGVLVGEDGTGLRGWMLRVEGLGATKDTASLRVGDDGSFRTHRVAPGEYRLFAHPRDPMIGDEVEVGKFDVASCPLRVIVPRAHVPTSRVRGRIVPPPSVPLKQRTYVWVQGTATKDLVQVPCDDDGKYEAGPLQRGRYVLWVECSAFGQVAMGSVDVADDRDTDAGAFEVPAPGTLVVHCVDGNGNRAPDGWVVARSLADDLRRVGLQHREGRSRGFLQPGRWLVTTRDRTAMAATEADVRAGETTEVRLVVPDGVKFVLRKPPLPPDRCPLRIRWSSASGLLLREQRESSEERASEDELSAPAGRYTLEVIDARGNKTSATFDLRASEPPQVVELPL